MLRSALTDGTFAYMAFLACLFAYKTLRPQARRSRKLRKAISHYSAKS